MRPRASTAVASTMTRPAPDIASCMRCCRCQSLATPSRAEYWHMGETTMRLGKCIPPIASALNRWDSGAAGDVADMVMAPGGSAHRRDVEQLQGVEPFDLRHLVARQAAHRGDQFPGPLLAHVVGIVGAEQHPVGTEEIDQMAQHLGVEHHRIDIEGL